MSDKQVLRASEIGEYVFCHRAWWLHRVQGIASAHREQMDTGTVRHEAHGRAVQRADTLRRAAIFFLAFAGLFAALLLSEMVFSLH